MKRIKVDFAGLTPTELVEKTNFIIGMMTGNTNFTTPKPTLVEMQTVTTGLQTAITKAEQGTKAEKNDRDDKAAFLVVLLVQLAAYVSNEAADNETVMLSSGFDLEKTKTPIGPLPAVGDVRTKTTGVTGQIDIRWKAVRGAGAYKVQVSLTPDAEASWVLKDTVTKARSVVTGLPSLTVHYFRIAAIGALGQGPWSEVADGFAK